MKNKNQKKNNNNKAVSSGRRGFTLVEMLISMFIFSMVVAMVMGAYLDVFQSKRKTRAVQQDVEDARYAMELMAKTLRMSSVFSGNGSSNSIRVYDYSQKKCLEYRLNGDTLQVGTGGAATCRINDKTLSDGTTIGDQKVWISGCDSAPASGWKDMTTANVNRLTFNTKKSKYADDPLIPNDRELGHVVMSYQICYQNDCATTIDSATIQTSTSLRDYSYINDGRSNAYSSSYAGACPPS